MLIYYIFLNINNTEAKKIRRNNVPKISMQIAKPSLIEDIKKEREEELLATITIKEIGIENKPIYKIESKKNNIEQNITILKESILPDKENSIIFLAAHSGIGNLAYFKNLHKLQKNQKIIFYYQEKEYQYIITNIYEEEKNGYIRIWKKDKKELILTTCGEEENKQLIIESILIKEQSN